MIKIILSFVFVLVGGQAQALTIDALKLSTDGWTLYDNYWTGTDNSNLSAAEIAAIVGVSELAELYKDDVDGGEGTGSDALSYDPYYTTYYFNSESDPKDATIMFDGPTGENIDSTNKFLYVKDGNHTPAFYVFDIGTAWDGIEDLVMVNFWASRGAISHVTILGNSPVPVPEPAIMLLFGTGLVGLAGARLRKKKK